MADGKETQRSLAALRASYPESAVEKVEYWNHYSGKRHDLFGFGDVLVAGPDSGFLLVQVTTKKQMSARRSKILGKPQRSDSDPEKAAAYRLAALRSWIGAGGRVIIQGWDQPGGPRSLWQLTEWEIELPEQESE